MKRSLDRALCRDFPLLYKQRDWEMTQTCMCWGFPGSGWHDIIRDLSEELEPLIEAQDPDARASAGQVKEKFGTLRFYLDGDETDEMRKAVKRAEKRSAVTCEQCGEPGKSRSSGWIKTLCDVCHETRYKHTAAK
jgi:hypothetical protein